MSYEVSIESISQTTDHAMMGLHGTMFASLTHWPLADMKEILDK